MFTTVSTQGSSNEQAIIEHTPVLSKWTYE